MMDFDIKRTARRCHATDRELKPGESFYSELVEENNEMRRVDYCEEAWNGPTPNCIGWWKARIPERDSGKVYWAPRNVQIAYFEQLLSSSGTAVTAYVMALLLVRRRVLQLVDSHCEEGSHTEVMELYSAKDKNTYHVAVQSPAPGEIALIQQELASHLFMDEPPEEE